MNGLRWPGKDRFFAAGSHPIAETASRAQSPVTLPKSGFPPIADFNGVGAQVRKVHKLAEGEDPIVGSATYPRGPAVSLSDPPHHPCSREFAGSALRDKYMPSPDK
jgi:hypothetical protein